MSDDTFELGQVSGIVQQIDQRTTRLETKMDDFIEAAFQARTLWEQEATKKAEASNWRSNIGAGVISAAVASILTWIQVKFG